MRPLKPEKPVAPVKKTSDQDYGIVVVGASAGGVSALSRLVSGLPGTLQAAVFVVQHLKSGAEKSRLKDILALHTRLRVARARDQMPVQKGWVYVAEPGRHLRIKQGIISLDKGEPVRFVRPSVDVLFRSAAEHYGSRVVGVVLTGIGSDGAEGCRAVKKNGGICMVQDRETAQFFDMPEAAIATGTVSHVMPIHQMADTVIRELKRLKKVTDTIENGVSDTDT